MCEICRQTPCDNRCPNAVYKPMIITAICEECGDDIYSDYTHWVDNEGNIFCSRECVEKHYGIEEVDL